MLCTFYRFQNSNNSELLWRLARVLCEQGKQCKNLDEKKRLFDEALSIISKSIEHEPEEGCFGAHKWYIFLIM